MAHPSLSLSNSKASPGEDPQAAATSNRADAGKIDSGDGPKQVVANLRAEIGQRQWDLNTSLQRIAKTAQTLTAADGAAIAMRRGTETVCLARAGGMAPPLGTKLDLSSGVSGECLRTARAVRCEDTTRDARVDPEVRSQLGLWSLAAVPLGKEPNVIGILEVFSALPYSFSLLHMELLEELAELVVAVHRGSTQAATEESEQLSLRSRVAAAWTGPGSARVAWQQRLMAWFGTGREKFESALRTSSGRRLVISCAIGALAISLGLGWLFGRSGPAKNLPEWKAAAAVRPEITNTHDQSSRLRWNFKAAPVGQVPKRSPSSLLVVAGKRQKETFGGAPPQLQPESQTWRVVAPEKPNAAQPVGPDTDHGTVQDAPEIAAAHLDSENPLGGVLSVPASLPPPVMRVSDGVTGGVVAYRVDPIYPAQARAMRIEGTVVLRALVAETYQRTTAVGSGSAARGG
jgi:GAF domain-containing protein